MRVLDETLEGLVRRDPRAHFYKAFGTFPLNVYDNDWREVRNLLASLCVTDQHPVPAMIARLLNSDFEDARELLSRWYPSCREVDMEWIVDLLYAVNSFVGFYDGIEFPLMIFEFQGDRVHVFSGT